MKFCVGCQEEKPYDAFKKINGKKILKANCEECLKDINETRETRVMRDRFLRGDEKVSLCECGKIFTKVVKTPTGIYNPEPIIFESCQSCRRKK